MSNVYETYVDVDEKWVKKIPAHWQMKRLKAIFAMRKEKNNPVVTENILSLTAKQGVVPYAEKEGTGGNKPKSDMTQYNIAHENDLLVNCMNVVSGAAGVSRYFGAISPVYYALYPHNDENVWYYHHIFRLMPFQRSLVGLGKGILMHESDEGTLTSVRMRISMDYLGNVLLPVPPRDEQDQIVKYLNWKVSEINKLIKFRKKELLTLEELKKKIISDTITKGIDSEANHKMTSIRWIGAIPEHWEIIKAKKVIKITNGSDPKTKGEIPVYGSGGAFKTCGEYKEPPVVLLGRKGTLNKPQYVDCRYWNVDTAFDVREKANQINLKYYYYCAFLFDYGYYMTQTALPSMTQTDYGNMYIPLPPLNEQEKIVEVLEERLLALSKLIASKEEIIKELVDLKNRIISDVVTGAIDVRSEIIPDYEIVEDTEDSSDDDLDGESTDEEV